jgi:hypothetical protein
MMRKRALTTVGALLLGAGVAFQPKSAAQPAVPTPPPGNGTVKSIDLPQLPPDLPEGPGKNAITGSCIICHSNRYITLQPPFPRKTWEAIVDKMRKTYGAPVPDAAVPQIVDYLMAVRGKAEPATKPAGEGN